MAPAPDRPTVVRTMPARTALSRGRRLDKLAGELNALDKDIAQAREDAPTATSGHLNFHKADDPPPHPHGEPVRLEDGATILVRPIEPEDQHELELGFRKLGALSRYEYFCRPVDEVTAEELAYFAQVDHESEEAIVATDARTGEGIGVARYARDPDDPRQAYFACTVIDSWQERGVGAVLADHLADRARASGIVRFRSLLLVGNNRGKHLLEHVADKVDEIRVDGVVEIRARLRPTA